MLKRFIKPSTRVYTVLKHVSSSGMSRRIETLVITKEKGREAQIWNCSKAVARACGFSYNDKHGAIVVGGCGMDMGYHIVYALSSVLFRNNFYCTGEGCHSNDHINDRDGSWERSKNKGRKHSDGGYALTHSWL